jgi:hypothetical protein
MTQGLTQTAKEAILEGKLKVVEVKSVSTREEDGLSSWPQPVAGRIHYDSIEIDPNDGKLTVHFRQKGMPIYKIEVVLTGGTVTVEDLDGYLEVSLND